MKTIVYVLFLVILGGCVNTSRFVQSQNYSELNGEYYAYSESEEDRAGKNISSLYGNYGDLPDSFTFEAKKDSLYISYFVEKDSVLVKKRFPIEGKRKKRFIKNVISCEIIPFFPILMKTDIYVKRFGKDKFNNLLIHTYSDRSGMLLFMAAGSTSQGYYVYKKLDQIKLKRPYFENGKYGIINEKSEKITEPIFSSLSAFEKGIARAEINGKKGIVDENGQFVIPAQYDCLEKHWGQYPTIYEASQNGKFGILSKDGKTLVPFEYEDISMHYDGIFVLHSLGKIGIYVPYEVYIPPIYTDYGAKSTFRKYLLVFQNQTPYILDFDGNQYEVLEKKYKIIDFSNSPTDDNSIYYKNKIYTPKYETRTKVNNGLQPFGN